MWTEALKLDRIQPQAACSASFTCSAGSACDSLLLSPARLIIPFSRWLAKRRNSWLEQIGSQSGWATCSSFTPARCVPSVLISAGSEQQGLLSRFLHRWRVLIWFLFINLFICLEIVLIAMTESRGATGPCVCKLISQSAVNARKKGRMKWISLFICLFFHLFLGTGDHWCWIVRRSSTHPHSSVIVLSMSVSVSCLTSCFSTLFPDLTSRPCNYFCYIE